MKVSHHPDYFVELPEGHPFPMAKYRLIREILLARRIVSESDLVAPEEAPLDRLRRVHSQQYLEKLESGTLSAQEQRRLGVPWSQSLWRRARLASDGTYKAAQRALAEGISGNLAGGTHHAFVNRGEGFCVLNDVAIAIRALQAEGRISRALVVDLDVHQGNGTASIFDGDLSVFTFSIHGANNYPAEKMRSTLDVALPDQTDDRLYIDALSRHLPQVLGEFQSEIVFYLAGVDVARGDRYGRFLLSDEGVRARDRFVISQVRDRNLPLVITLAGGYASTAERTAELHALVFEEARISNENRRGDTARQAAIAGRSAGTGRP